MALVLCASFEKLMFASSNGLFTELTLDNLEPCGDLLVVYRGAVATQEKLGDVGRNRILTLEFTHKIFANHVAFKGFGRDCIDSVQSLTYRVNFQVWCVTN